MLSILSQNQIFELNLGTIISFLIGIALGAVLVCLIYALLVIGSLRNKKFLIKTDDDSLTVSDVKELIIQSQKEFKDKKLRGEKSKPAYCLDICTSLTYGIATKFYPHSKYPLFELSIDEVLMLLKYVSDRVEDILDRRVIRRVKKVRISSIIDMTNKTNKVINSNTFKMSKEVSTVVSTVKKVINTVNPAWWIRKGVVDTTIDAVVGKICLAVIAIVGEETYKIYSKKVFNQEVEIESNVDAIMNSVTDDILDIKKSSEEALKVQKDFLLDTIYEQFKMKSNKYSPNLSDDYKSEIDINMPMKGMIQDEKEENTNIS